MPPDWPEAEYSTNSPRPDTASSSTPSTRSKCQRANQVPQLLTGLGADVMTLTLTVMRCGPA